MIETAKENASEEIAEECKSEDNVEQSESIHEAGTRSGEIDITNVHDERNGVVLNYEQLYVDEKCEEVEVGVEEEEEEEENNEEKESTHPFREGVALLNESNVSIPQAKRAYTEAELLLLSNTFPLLQSYVNNPLTLIILTYLSALELVQLAPVSHGFSHVSNTPLLWKALLRRDFKLTSAETTALADEVNVKPLLFHDSSENKEKECTSVISASRDYYEHKWKGMKRRVAVARSQCHSYKLELSEDTKRARVECCLDFTLLRFFIPFLLASIFSSMLLVAMWIDGNLSTNVFVCLSPLLAFLIYMFICSCIHYYLYKKQSDGDEGDSFLGGLWMHSRGVLRFLYVDVFEEDNRAVVVCFAAMVLLLAQILLLGFKLSEEDITSVHSQNILQWELVFLPTWLIFLLVLIAPCLGCINMPVFIASFVILWIPFFILFVCLSLKLKGMENNTKDRNLRLALILIPFWIYEGGVMLGALLSVVEICFRLRRNLCAYFSLVLERLGERC